MSQKLARRLGLFDATAIGLSSMLGAGVFVVFAPAAASAGSGLLIALALAGFVAYCHAAASAQLAAVYPTSGGAYIYGRERLGEWWGFIAGWGFVIGKTASCAAMAATFAAYSAPGYEKPAAVAAIAVLVAVNYFGVTRTALVSRILLTIVVAVLATVTTLSITDASTERLGGSWFVDGPLGILQAAGLLFFAFAGYARIATMGEEVRNPGRTIPRAILIALGSVLVIYLVIGLTLLLVLGPDRLATSTVPMVDALRAAGYGELSVIARIGAAAASLGALLALIAGIGRTALAMGRNHDLPAWFSAVHRKNQVPHHAELALGALLCVLVVVADLRHMIGFSSFGVLIYYAIANASAFTQPPVVRRWPRWLNIAGLVACALLVATLPVVSVLVGLGVFAVGLLGRLIAVRRH